MSRGEHAGKEDLLGLVRINELIEQLLLGSRVEAVRIGVKALLGAVVVFGLRAPDDELRLGGKFVIGRVLRRFEEAHLNRLRLLIDLNLE